MLQVNVARLHDDNREALSLAWVAGREGGTAVRREAAQAAALIGHLNLTHPNSIQVIGAYEAGIIGGFVERLLESHPAAVIVADGVAPPPALVESATRTQTPLFTSPLPAPQRDRAARALPRPAARRDAPSCTACSWTCSASGVLITGESGVGKSELGLELISRGHGLVADDVVEVSRIAAARSKAAARALLKDFIEVRGLGVLNIRTIFGETAVRREDEAAAGGAPRAALARRARPDRAPAALRAHRGDPRRHRAQGDHPGRRRPQPRGAGRGRGAQRNSQAARHRLDGRVPRASEPGNAERRE